MPMMAMISGFTKPILPRLGLWRGQQAGSPSGPQAGREINDQAIVSGSPAGALKFRNATVCEASRNAIIGPSAASFSGGKGPKIRPAGVLGVLRYAEAEKLQPAPQSSRI